MYALLNEIGQQQRHILSVEDPVEYSLEGMEQVQVNTRKGVTFSSVLRHFLRHDPDVIMVGEIRDQETAVLANRAALTGHLVMSTLHTHDTLGAVTRLLNMGIERYLLSDTLIGVVAQRLVRVICRHCRSVDTPAAAIRRRLGLAADDRLWRGRGCRSCHHSGFSGRRLVTEILPVGPLLAASLASAEPQHHIATTLRQQGMRFLPDRALDLVRQGLTTADEIVALGLDDVTQAGD